MDFNVLKMTAVVYVIRDGLPISVGELTGVRDTPTMCDEIKQRYPSHGISIYPDASGKNASSKSASLSDLSILRDAGFSVHVNSQNPLVKDRVLSMNAMLLNAQGERRLKVNTRRCPKYTEALEQQAYDTNGAPDKTTGHDHINDAGGYFIVYRYPVIKPMATHINMGIAF